MYLHVPFTKKFNIKTYLGVCKFDYGIFNDAWKWQERPAWTGQTKGIFCGFWELEAKKPKTFANRCIIIAIYFMMLS
jgi:hypothetical protein